MTIAYQYDADGYFAGMVEDYGVLPNNATYEPVEVPSGFMPRWTGTAWEQTEDHKGESGYLNGAPCTIKDYGPYPAGWSATPPPVPFSEALDNARTAIRSRRRAAEYGGFLCNGQRWGSEEKDELRLHSMISMMRETGLTEFPNWKINADTVITLTPELAVEASAALMRHYAACFALEAEKSAALEAACAAGRESAEAVQAWLEANLETGWPGL